MVEHFCTSMGEVTILNMVKCYELACSKLMATEWWPCLNMYHNQTTNGSCGASSHTQHVPRLSSQSDPGLCLFNCLKER